MGALLAEALEVRGAEQTVVVFGNLSPQMQLEREDGSRFSVPARHLSVSTTTVSMRDGFDDPGEVDLALSTDNDRVLALIGRELGAELRRYAVGVGEMEQIVGAHTGGGAPAWIVSSDAQFAAALSKHFGCPVGEPTMLLTNLGRDSALKQAVIGTGVGAAMKYMGLANSASATAPAASDTALTGEIVTASGGLVRGTATYAHTAGTNTSTLTRTFTANGSDSLPVTVSQVGLFYDPSGGPTLSVKSALPANATLAVVGDSVTVTETITFG